MQNLMQKTHNLMPKDAEFDAKNSAKSDAKSVLQMCTNVVQNDALQSDANEHFNTVPHARVNKQTN